MLRILWQILYDGEPNTLETDIERLETIIDVANQLNLHLYFGYVQEAYYNCLGQKIVPNCLGSDQSCPWDKLQLKPLLNLGHYLGIDVSSWLASI